MKSFYLSTFLLVLLLAGCGPTAESFNQKGAEAFRQKDLNTAKTQFQRAVFFNGSNPAYHNNLGYVLDLLKDYDGAEAEFRKALDDHPDDKLLTQIQIDQALLYCDTGAIQAKPSHKDWAAKGIEVLKGLIGRDPNNAELHMHLGFAYFQATNPGSGFLELNRAVELATPEQVAKYSPDPVGGALFILKQVQQFYVKIHLFKQEALIQKKILQLEKKRPPTPIHR